MWQGKQGLRTSNAGPDGVIAFDQWLDAIFLTICYMQFLELTKAITEATKVSIRYSTQYVVQPRPAVSTLYAILI